MHRQPETAAALRIIADLEPAAAGFRIGAMRAVDAAAQHQDVVEQAEIGKHRQPGRLQDQSGPDWLWRVEAFEDGDPVPGTLQIECRGQSGRAGPAIAMSRKMPIARRIFSPKPDNPSAVSPIKPSHLALPLRH